MANDVKLIGFKAPIDFYEEVKAHAQERGMSLSGLLRYAVKQILTEANPPAAMGGTGAEVGLKTLTDQLQVKDEYLREKDRQIERLQSDLSEQSKRHDTIVLQMTQQLDRANVQIEDLRVKKPFFQRVFGRR